ncbi:glycosyltransferase family 8 protein [bacterium]|nr:glycosyltransferase family 8 protein [bacterium]
MINIAFITDNNYVFPVKVAIKSIIANKNVDTQYNINIICVEMCDDSCRALKSLEKLGNEKVFINLIDKKNIFKDIKMPAYVTPSALFKFSLAEILDNIDKCLYIDGDTMIQKDLSEFYNIDIDSVYAGVIQDYHTIYYREMNKKLNLDGYFNSGVMLLNLKKMRKDGIAEKLMAQKKKEIETNTVVFMDQNALNVVFEENVKYLPIIYNYSTVYNIDETVICLPDDIRNNLQYYKDNAVIVHFAGGAKPWKILCLDKHFVSFWKYVDSNDFLQIMDAVCNTIQQEKVNSIYYFDGKINAMSDNISVLENKNFVLNGEIEILSREIEILNNEIEILKNRTLILENEISVLKENKKYPKWFCNLVCCFIVKKKDRHHFRNKYSR